METEATQTWTLELYCSISEKGESWLQVLTDEESCKKVQITQVLGREGLRNI